MSLRWEIYKCCITSISHFPLLLTSLSVLLIKIHAASLLYQFGNISLIFNEFSININPLTCPWSLSYFLTHFSNLGNIKQVTIKISSRSYFQFVAKTRIFHKWNFTSLNTCFFVFFSNIWKQVSSLNEYIEKL